MNHTLSHLLLEALNIPDFRLTRRQLAQDFGAVSPLLLAQNLLIPTQTDLQVLCDLCGQTHLAIFLNGKYYFNCENDDTAGIQEVAEDDLRYYKFSWGQFAAWLTQQMKVQGKTTVVTAGQLWHLGSVEAGGNKYATYLVLSSDLQTVKNQAQNLIASATLMFWFDKNLHTTTHMPPNIINVFEFIDIKDSTLKFDYSQFHSHLASPVTTQPADLVLDTNIVATHRADGYFLLFGAQSDNTFDYSPRISPLGYKLLAYLFTIHRYVPNSRSSQELATQGMAKNARTITTAFKKINDLAGTCHQKAIVMRLAKDQYCLNPELDCFT